MKITRMRWVAPTPYTDCEAAYAFHFDEGAAPNVTIEYATGSRDASPSHARHLVQDYLERGEVPPRRIVVDRAGTPTPADK
jgi:hypothetical protein